VVINPEKFQTDPTVVDVTRDHPVSWNKNINAYFLSIPAGQWNSFITYASHIALELFPILAVRTPPETYATRVRSSMLNEGVSRVLCPIVELAKNAQFYQEKMIFSKQDWDRIMWPVVIAATTTAVQVAAKRLLNAKDDKCSTKEDLKVRENDPLKVEKLDIDCNALKYNSAQLTTLVSMELAPILNATMTNLVENSKSVMQIEKNKKYEKLIS